MAVYSMTGYANVMAPAPSAPSCAATQPPDAVARKAAWSLDIRSVNSRFLDIAIKLPDELRQLEPTLRGIIQKSCRRGKVELRVQCHALEAAAGLGPSPAALARLAQVESVVCSALPHAAPMSVAEVLHWSQKTEPAEPLDPASVLGSLNNAIADWLAARAREGAKLSSMLQERVVQLQGLVHDTERLVPQQIEQQRQKFAQRLAEALTLTGSDALSGPAQERVLVESAAFASRTDVSEELTRLGAHLLEMIRLLNKGGELGKRLDFLVQELHREANTLGSKSASLDMTRLSMDMKVLIEQMREQVQNIE